MSSSSQKVVLGAANPKMKYVRLGNSGLKVSNVCVGCMTFGDSSSWMLNEEASRVVIKRALELGVNFFDTADAYSRGKSEEILGRALRDFADREQVIVATKCCMPAGPSPNQLGLSRKHIFHAIDNSLRRLGLDYVDLFQIHRWDDTTPIEETMKALHDVVQSGKVRYIGASTMTAWQFAKAQFVAEKNGWTKFITMQNHYNLVYREEEREMNPLCVDQGVALIPYAPLAGGFLSGNRKRGQVDKSKVAGDIVSSIFVRTTQEGETERARTDNVGHFKYHHPNDYDVADQLQTLADAKKLKPAQVALAWIYQKQGVVSPIIGFSKLEQLEEAVRASDITLTVDEIRVLESAYKPHAVIGFNVSELSEGIAKFTQK